MSCGCQKRVQLVDLLRTCDLVPRDESRPIRGVSLDSSELQQWGETAGRWRSLQHKDLAGAELVLVLGRTRLPNSASGTHTSTHTPTPSDSTCMHFARSSSSKLPGLVLWNEASGMSKDMVHILRRRLCSTLRARAVPDRAVAAGCQVKKKSGRA